MQINDVHQGIVKRKERKRVGRGPGSGHGKTCGKGDKGHSSRQGFSRRLSHEGGQMSIVRRVAKRGFSNAFFTTRPFVLNLGDLNELFEAGAEVNPEVLVERGIVKGKYDLIKILATGEITKPLTVKAHAFSAAAEAKIAAAGGRAERIGVA